jgi:hypothetical protein
LKKIDLVMGILLEEKNFRLLGRDFDHMKGIDFFEIFDFDCSDAIKSIIGYDFFGENYYDNVDPYIEGHYSEEEFKLRVLEWDITLQEEITPELKSVVFEKLLKEKRDLELKIKELYAYGVIFINIHIESFFDEILVNGK